MKRHTLKDLASIARFGSIFSAMIAVLLGFLLPYFYLSGRSALWILPKVAASQYASLFVVAFMMVMLLMATPAIVSYVLAPIQRGVTLQNPRLYGLVTIVFGIGLALLSLLLPFALLGLVSAAIAVAFLGVGIDILSGLWEPATHGPRKDSDDSEIRTKAAASHGKSHENACRIAFSNWCFRAIGGFLALALSWLEAAAAVSGQSMSQNENYRIAFFLIATAVLLTTLGNALGVRAAQGQNGSSRNLLVAAIALSLIVFVIGQWAPVTLFVMRLSGMGGIDETIYLKPDVSEGRILPGFVTKPQHGPLEVCMVAQAGRAFYISRRDINRTSESGPGACAEQIDGPNSYRIWRLPRADVAWLKEAKPLTSTASHKTSQSPITKGGPQRADVETLPKGL